MANSDILHEILNLRKQCFSKLNDNSNDLSNLCEQLFQWQEQVIKNVKQFVHEKIHEIKQKHSELHRQQVDKLDTLYRHCVDGQPPYNYEKSFSQLADSLKKNLSSLRIFHRKPIDFNLYLQFNADALIDPNRLSLSSYKMISAVPIHSNVDSLIATNDCVLMYYDHDAFSAFLHVFELKTYLERRLSIRSCTKFRIPCTEFHGKIMHMEYCAYVQGFLLGTGSKLFTLKISTLTANHQTTEYFDFINAKLAGILKKFACYATSSHVIYLLFSTFEQYTVVRLDLSQNFDVLGQWDYPQEENQSSNASLTTDKPISRLTSINDFVLGYNVLVFAVTLGAESYQFHVRSLDMNLQYCFELSQSQCPLRLCMVPMDYSSYASGYEQFLVISKNSKRLSLYQINSNVDPHVVQFVEDVHIESEPKCLAFGSNDSSLLLARNLFSISIYKQNTATEKILRTPQIFKFPSRSSFGHRRNASTS